MSQRLVSLGRAALLIACAGVGSETAAQLAESEDGAEPDVGVEVLGALNDAGQWRSVDMGVESAKTRRFHLDQSDFILERIQTQGVSLPDDGEGVEADEQSKADPRELLRHEILDYVDPLAFDEMVEIIVEGVEIPFDQLEELRTATYLERSAILSSRKQLVVEAQREIVDFLQAHGASLIESQWLLNRLRVILPAGAVKAVLDYPGVIAAYPAWGRPANDGTIPIDPVYYDGRDLREQTGAQNLIDLGYNGETGGRTNTTIGEDNVKIAVIEVVSQGNIPWPINFINESHPGWRDWTNGPSRIAYAGYLYGGGLLSSQDCTNPPPLGLPLYEPFVCNQATHGTLVASLAAGSIMQNQDPNVSDPLEQSKRSGLAPEAAVLYFSANTYGGLSSALAVAALYGADVVNLSWGATENECGLCDPECNQAGMNEWFRTLTDLGVLIVSSAGNKNNDDFREYPTYVRCNVQWPSTRPEVISVGGVAGYSDYTTASIGDFSARGWMPIGIGGWLGDTGFQGEIPAVSVAAPGAVKLHFTEDDTYSNTSQSERYGQPIRGTSVASPIVTGGAAILRHAYPVHAWFGAGYLRALMLVMADAEEERETYGVGRFMLRDLMSLNAPAGWYSPAFDIEDGEGVEFIFPGTENGSGAMQFKLAIYIDEPDVNEVPWIVVTVDDVCNSTQSVAFDDSISLEKLIDVTTVEYPDLPTSCLRVRLLGQSVAEGGVTVYTSGYFHNDIH